MRDNDGLAVECLLTALSFEPRGDTHEAKGFVGAALMLQALYALIAIAKGLAGK